MDTRQFKVLQLNLDQKKFSRINVGYNLIYIDQIQLKFKYVYVYIAVELIFNMC